jgi:uncharacterized DUF497 family protein
MDFEWDQEKGVTNERKHGVTFEQAARVFGDDYSSTVRDPDHSLDEERFLIFGKTQSARYVVVSFTERDGRIRIISARPMTPRERRGYER